MRLHAARRCCGLARIRPRSMRFSAAWMAPDDPRIQWALANTLWRVGRREEAVPVYQQVIALLPDEPAPRS